MRLSAVSRTLQNLGPFQKERAEALEHLDFAIKKFKDMRMQPWLERS
jgi:hypothetical protein